MKQKLLMTTIGTIAFLWLASAQAAPPNPQFLGTWALDMSKSQPQPPAGTPGPKSVTVTVRDVGGGKWVSEVVIEMADGTKQSRPATTVSMDGKPVVNPENPDVSITVTSPDSNTVIATVMKDGMTVETNTYKLSADGKQMVHTTDGIGPDGSPMHGTQVLNKKS
jgi:hypothetical protein